MGEKLRAARIAAGLTQLELAKRVGCYQKDISRWERAEVEPTASVLRKLADAIGCLIDDIVP